MDLRKKVNAWVLGLAVLLAAGCGEDEKKQEDPTPVNQVQKNCLLTREINGQGNITQYNYNSSGQLESMDHIYPGQKHHANEMSYNADGNIIELKCFQPTDNLMDQKWLYSYNADKLLESKKYLMLKNNVWEERMVYFLKYNAAQQLIKHSTHFLPDTAAVSYSLYSYPAPDQVIENMYFKDAAGNYSLTYKVHYHFDNKKFSGTSLGYLHFPDVEASLLKRNVLSISSLDYRTGITTTDKFAYNYNADGYPVQIVNPATGVGYYTFDYNCQ